jgi:hypothetical protein
VLAKPDAALTLNLLVTMAMLFSSKSMFYLSRTYGGYGKKVIIVNI